jgi:tetratricopeptide (TPR) repeat protein
MPSKKVSRKKLLKEPDEFISTTGQAIEFLRTHQRQVTRAAVIVLIVVAAGVGTFYYLRSQEGKALVMQQQGLQFYQQAYQGSLENPAADKKSDFQKALEKFKESLAAYSWGRTAQVSQVFIGNCYYALKEYDQAREAYSKSLEGPFRQLAMNGLAYISEAQGDFQKALEYYQTNMKDPHQPYRIESMLGAARCYEALKEKPKALEIYQKALAQAPQSSMTDFIRWKVSELKG